METSKKAGDLPKVVELVQGRTYVWSACAKQKRVNLSAMVSIII